MVLLNATQWFLALFAAAIGLTIASLLWRLPQIERLEAVEGPPEPDAFSPEGEARTG